MVVLLACQILVLLGCIVSSTSFKVLRKRQGSFEPTTQQAFITKNGTVDKTSLSSLYGAPSPVPQVPRCDPNGPIKCNPLGRPGSVLPQIIRDDESVPEIPLDAGITDFKDVVKPEVEIPPSLGFPPGCARSAPTSTAVDLAAMAMGGITTESNAEKEAPGGTQESGLNTQKSAAIPFETQCPSFIQQKANLDDWVSGSRAGWTVMAESLTPRLIYGGSLVENSNALLVANEAQCVPITYHVDIRLQDASEAGIAFRLPAATLASPLSTYLAASISTQSAESEDAENNTGGSAQLLKVTPKGEITVLASKPVARARSNILLHLGVTDHGSNGLVEGTVNEVIGRTCI